MKNKFPLIGLCLWTAFGLVSCGSPTPSESIVNKYKASFECNGGSSVEPFFADVIATAPVTKRDAYDFAGWFIDEAFSNEASFPYSLTQDTTFYAKWSHRLMEPSGTPVVSAKVGEEEAKAYVLGEYQKDALRVRVNVQDNKVFHSFLSSESGELNGYNDNFEIYVTPLFGENTGLDVHKTYRILSVPTLGFNVFQINSDKTFESTLISDSGVAKSDEKIYVDAQDGFNGYGATITIPYSLLGLSSQEEAKDNMGVWFAFRNTNGKKNSETTYAESAYLGSNKAYGWTYLNFDDQGNPKRKNVDAVFFGDSYVDTDFYRNFKLEFKGSSLFAVGKPGSKTRDWIDENNPIYPTVTEAKPNRVFIHLGFNDIQGGISVEDTVKNLNTLFTKVQESNPNVKMDWISSPNPFGNPADINSPNSCKEKLEEVRRGVENLNLPFLTIKDGNDFTKNEHASFLNDGLHPNLFTYAGISKWMKEQLGDSAPIANSLFGTSKDKMSTSPQVDLSQKETISSQGFLDTFAFVKESGDDASFSLETKMKIGQPNNGDPYTKFGVLLKHGKTVSSAETDDSGFCFVYIDNSGSVGSDRTVSVATYHQFDRVRGADWQFNEPNKEISKPLDSSYDYKEGFIDLRFVKNGSSYAFYAGDMGTPVLTFEGWNDACSVGLMSFNLPFEAKDSSYSVNKEQKR